MFENYKCRAFFSVIGAFMIAMAIGLMYLWGIIAIYATSYFRIVTSNLNLTEQTTNFTFPFLLLGHAISIPIAGRLYKRTNHRFVCMVCGGCLSAFIYFASYSQSFGTFVWMFGFAPGVIIGFLYVYPTAHCFQYFPHKRTFISGLIISASGIGTLIFSIMAFDTINHQNQRINETYGFYGTEIALKFPAFLRNLSLLLLLLVVGGATLLFQVPSGLQLTSLSPIKDQKKRQLLNRQFLIQQDQKQQDQKNPFGNMNYQMSFISKGYDNNTSNKKQTNIGQQREFWQSLNIRQSSQYNPPQSDPNNLKQTDNSDRSPDKGGAIDNINQCPQVRDGPKQPIFWVLFACMLLSSNFGLLISCNYKTYVKYKMDDQFLTFMGAIGALACGVSRFLWSQLMLKFEFKYLLWLLLIVNSFLAFTVYYFSGIPFFYMIYVLITWVLYGGLLGMFPAITSSIFGTRYSPQIYGLLFYAFPISNFVQFLLIRWLEFQYGYWFVFMASGGMSVCGLLLSNRITAGDYNWSHRIRQHNQRKRLMAH